MQGTIMYLEAVTVLLIAIVNSVECVGTPELIRRRAEDVVRYQNGNHETCNEANHTTFDIALRSCRSKEDFFKECPSFALTPSTEPQVKRLILAIVEEKTVTFDSQYAFTNATIVSTLDSSYANGTFCRITSLEVHRGENQMTMIDHRGFSLEENATINIHTDNLAYGFDNYMGELYRMSLSCFKEGFPPGGCLFFKLQGETNLTKPKFNCAVPGSDADECPTPMPPQSSIVKQPPITENPQPSSEVTRPDDNTAPWPVWVGDRTTTSPVGNSTALSSLALPVGIGCGVAAILILLCLVVCISCSILVYRRRKMKLSAITSDEMERRISTASKQMEASNEKDIDLHLYEAPGDALRTNTFGCNCLEDNPAYQKPITKDGEAEKILECNYAVIPECQGSEPTYQEIAPKIKVTAPARRRSKSKMGSATRNVIFVDNPLYEHSQSLPPPRKGNVEKNMFV